MIDCTEAVHRMWAYLEHVLGPLPTGELEAHLDTCQRCCGELEFNERMRVMVAERSPGPEVPGELRARLEELLQRSPIEPEARS